MGGGHHAPKIAEPEYFKHLAPKSGLCPPDFHYPRDIWYPHGGFYPDPVGWRKNLVFALGAAGLLMFGAFQMSVDNEKRYRAPKIWIPSLLWNANVPAPVDFRGRTLDKITGQPVDAAEH